LAENDNFAELVSLLLEAGLNYGDYRPKLVHFESQKKYFLCLCLP